MKLLVVDDDPLVRRALTRALRRRGHDVVEAGGVAEALAALEAGPFDGAVTDVWMPERDGFALLAEARERAPELPIVVITGLPHPAHEARALQLGARAFRKKPVRASELERLLEDPAAEALSS
ncbi:MAG: response regulator [Myxococcota bacterium]